MAMNKRVQRIVNIYFIFVVVLMLAGLVVSVIAGPPDVALPAQEVPTSSTSPEP